MDRGTAVLGKNSINKNLGNNIVPPSILESSSQKDTVRSNQTQLFTKIIYFCFPMVRFGKTPDLKLGIFVYFLIQTQP
ncbi:MAG: hypothetical protein DWQ53_14715 [Microcystis flos-aquae DF17]|jgi:hypothetical protein|uniref:Uncharacterized protein n=1 Tax=Microcystis aeruginosa (strain NIES-843 / IAM M-2473) TaxID=449447 RepID=B0JTM7_MICAN|nr:MAG: hypothetical protein DWQ53_14715 [Microcystis flos-aquae DF17]BAG04330.1 unknown protein [Microcystis aeruginosa NIES-843]